MFLNVSFHSIIFKWPYYSHFAFLKPFTATLTTKIFTAIQILKTATFEESGRDGGHLATLITTDVLFLSWWGVRLFSPKAIDFSKIMAFESDYKCCNESTVLHSRLVALFYKISKFRY
jgi:hypothetical protein